MKTLQLIDKVIDTLDESFPNLPTKIPQVKILISTENESKRVDNDDPFSSASILVGRTVAKGKNKFIHPSVKGFDKIPVLSALERNWGALSPFHLKNEKNQRIENVWQFCKVYEIIEKQNQVRFGKIVWQYDQVNCFDPQTNKLSKEYWKWRETGMNHSKAVRFPVGKKNTHKCIYSIGLDCNENKKLNYIQARKEIYVKEYIKALKKHPKFEFLKQMVFHKNDKFRWKVIICEFDGPFATPQDLKRYKEKYNIDDLVYHTDCGDVMIPTKRNLKVCNVFFFFFVIKSKQIKFLNCEC